MNTKESSRLTCKTGESTVDPWQILRSDPPLRGNLALILDKFTKLVVDGGMK